MLLPLLAAQARGESVSAVSLAEPTIIQERWGNGDSLVVDVSEDGRFVVILSAASNLTMDQATEGVVNVFRVDRAEGSMVLVSRSSQGNRGGNDHSTSARITSDGSKIVYQSRASNLVENDGNGADDIFLWDAALGKSRLASAALGADDRPGNGGSSSPVITPDGRHIAFESAASDLVMDDTNDISDIFVRDMQEWTTRIASVGATRVDHPLSGSKSPVITGDGRYVVFESLAGDLVPGVRLTLGQVYLRDLAEDRTVWVSQHATNLLGAVVARCYNAVVSEDGRFVAFKSAPGGSGWPPSTLYRYDVAANRTEIIATDITGTDVSVGDDSGPAMTPDGRFIAFTRRPQWNSISDVYVWDSTTGEMELVSVNLEGNGGGNGNSDTPWISADGRYVTFLSSATNLVETAVVEASLWYMRDRESMTTTLLSVDPTGLVPGGQDITTPVISADTGIAVFDTIDDRLVAGDWNDMSDVFGREVLDSGLSLLSGTFPGLNPATGAGRSWSAENALSVEGRYVVFASEAEDLVPNDFNGVSDIFVRDLQSGSTILVSVNAAGTESANQASANPSISADGTRVAFASYASDLVSNDGNDREDVYVRDWVAGTTGLASVGTNGLATTPRVHTQPVLSPDGRYVAFQSRSTELVADPLTYTINLYVRDLEAGTTRLISQNLSDADLSFPLFGSAVFARQDAALLFDATTSWRGFIFRMDLTNGRTERVDVLRPGVLFDPYYAYSSGATISRNGQRIAFVSSNSELVEGDGNQIQDVFLRDRIIPETRRINVNTNGMSSVGDATEAAISDDGQWIAFTSQANDLAQGDHDRGPLNGAADRDIFLHEIETGTTRLISRSYRHSGSGNGPSYDPAISADGRYVVFRSAASDLVPNDFNFSNDVFIHDRVTQLTSLLSVSAAGMFAGDDRSGSPAISADGRVVLFDSWSSDLIAGDYNATADVFWGWTEGTGRPSSLVAGVEATPPGAVRVYWIAAPGLQYEVQFKNDLTASDWVELPGQMSIEGDRGMMEDPEPATSDHRYYRVVLKE